MTHYRATYTRADGSAGVLNLIARSPWQAWSDLFDALPDDVAQIRLRRIRPRHR